MAEVGHRERGDTEKTIGNLRVFAPHTTGVPYRPVPLSFQRLSQAEQIERLHSFRTRMASRRTVRHYSTDPVPDALIDDAIAVAGSAPSGANMQPWRFIVVRDPEVKRKLSLIHI